MLSASNISKAYSTRTLFSGLTLNVDAGRPYRADRIALIGSNDSGKTTLMDILAGDTPPDSGNISTRRDVSRPGAGRLGTRYPGRDCRRNQHGECPPHLPSRGRCGSRVFYRLRHRPNLRGGRTGITPDFPARPCGSRQRQGHGCAASQATRRDASRTGVGSRSAWTVCIRSSLAAADPRARLPVSPPTCLGCAAAPPGRRCGVPPQARLSRPRCRVRSSRRAIGNPPLHVVNLSVCHSLLLRVAPNFASRRVGRGMMRVDAVVSVSHGLIPAVSRPLAPRAARYGGHPRDSEAEV